MKKQNLAPARKTAKSPTQEKSNTKRAYGPREQGYGPPEITARAPATVEKPNLPPPVFDAAKDLRGTLEAVVFDEAGKDLSKMPVSAHADNNPSLDISHLVLRAGVVKHILLDS